MKTGNILRLNLHHEFFVRIAAKTKNVEYRNQTPYWRKRLEGRKYWWSFVACGDTAMAVRLIMQSGLATF